MPTRASEKNVIPILLGQGLDTKTDPKHLPAGKLLILENAVQKKRCEYRKRPGNVRIPNVDMSGKAIPNPDGIATFNDELLEYAGQTLYSYSLGAKTWINKGPMVSAIVRSAAVIKNTAQQSQVDSATNNGVTVYAWEDSRGGIRASVFDETTSTPMLSDVLLDGTATRARCLAFSAFLYVFYYKSGGLYVQRINPLVPNAFDAPLLISSTVNTANPTYDIYGYQNLRIMWVHNVQGSAAVKLGWLSDTPAVLSGVLGTTTIANEAATNSLAIIPSPANTFYICYHNTTNGVRCTILNNGAATLYAPFTVELITSSSVVNITGAATTSGIVFFYEIAAASAINQYVRTNTASNAGVTGTPADFMRSVGLWSKAWTYVDNHGTSQTYVGLVHSSPLQATFFVARSDGIIIAKQQPTLASGLTTRPILASVWPDAPGVFNYALLVKTQLVSENATIYTPTGITKTTLDFNNQEVFATAQLGNNLHIVGGVLSIYDGLSVVEHGFHVYPETLSFTSATTGGSIAGGNSSTTVYLYVAMYEWTDNYGQVHRSAGSVPLKVDLTASATNTNTITVTVDTLRLTAKRGNRTNVSIVLYRSEKNGSTLFYRVTSVLSPLYNDPTTDSVSFTDVLSDSSLISNEILYTSGGTLDNTGPPAAATIAVYKNRLFLGGLEQGYVTWFSKEHKEGLPVEFSDQLTKNVEPTGGEEPHLGITALHVLDDKLIAFKTDRFYYTFGDGPNDLGQAGDFANFIFVTADVGCSNASSIVRLPSGLMLRSSKGIYLLNSNFGTSYTGAGVEDYNSLTITSAVLVAAQNHVRFTTANGPILVFDYFYEQWSTWSGVPALDAIMWQGNYISLRANGAVWQETPGDFLDDGAPTRVRIGTGWITPANVMGVSRVYKYGILGEYKSPHKLRVQVAYDYSDAYLDVDIFDPVNDLPVSHFGDGNPFGADPSYGNEPIAYRYVSELRQQQCQAIKFLIEEITTSATAGTQEAFSITTLGLLAATKPGMAKLKGSLNKGIA